MKLKTSKVVGFTMIELMIVVAIIGVLSAVAIPAYIQYLRRSYLSEATTSIAAIKSAEESYFTINGCYISVGPTPSTIPAGKATAWPTTPPLGWGQNALSVRPDRSVRFQYQVYASNDVSSTGGCAAPSATKSDTYPGTQGCISGNFINGTLVPSGIFPDNWYVVVARGNLDGDSVASNIISVIDDSTVFMCNELE